jgi:hypothetical protein
MYQKQPECFPVEANNCFTVIYKVDVQWTVPFYWLFYNDMQGSDLVCTGSVSPEACLVVSEPLVHAVSHSFQENSVECFAWDG